MGVFDTRNKASGPFRFLLLLLLIVVPGVPAAAQTAGEPAASGSVPAASSGASAATDDLARLLEGLDSDQLAELVRQAAKARLKFERQQAAAEIKEDLLYEPKDVKEALKILQDNPADTQADNIDRIVKALAVVDAPFGKAQRLLSEGKAKEAAAAIKPNLDPQQSTYLSAAKYRLYAQALLAMDRKYEAVEAFEEIMASMPDRIAFAADAALQAARTYEALHRRHYAMQMYAYCLKNYALSLPAGELESLCARIDEIAKVCKDPMGAVACGMDDVAQRLGRSDSGKETRQKQQEIVAVLDDLIQTIEESRPSGGGPSPGKKPQRGKSPSQAQGQGKSAAPPSATGQPASPAKSSALVPGPVERPTKLSETRPTGGNDDWATMPPREREKIEQTLKKLLPERYRDLIGDYHTRLAEQEK